MIDFKHSGFISDIIYSLDAVREACLMNGEQAVLHLNVGEMNESHTNIGSRHQPLRLLKEDVDALWPLLTKQDYISDVTFFKGDYNNINVDLDLWSSQPINFNGGDNRRYYLSMTGISTDLSTPSLDVKINERYNNKVVISLSTYLNNPNVDYTILNDYTDKGKFIFIGSEIEYQKISKFVSGIKFVKPKDYLEAAQIIKGSSLFIGNQNDYYAIAEGLKTKRMLVVSPQQPNVIPMGGECYDVHYTKLFEFLLNKHFNG
jgi:hypothetical protein